MCVNGHCTSTSQTVNGTDIRNESSTAVTTTCVNGKCTSCTNGNCTSYSTEMACFPADAKIQLQSGRVKMMQDLEIGDVVLVSKGIYSPIYTFTHRDLKVKSTFISILLRNGHNLEVSPGHHLYIKNRNTVVAAESVKFGDDLLDADQDTSQVISIDRVVKSGLFNPHTVQGDILVNGVLTTTYTNSITDSISHTLLSPFRLSFKYFGLTTSWLEHISEVGVAFNK